MNYGTAVHPTFLRMLHWLDELEYDFAQFDLMGFIAVTAQKRHRPLHIFPYAFEPEITGLYLRTSKADYIFYRQDAPLILQSHSILHELGHVLLEHGGMSFDTLESEALRAIAQHKAGIEDSEDERAAEQFAVVIRDRIARAQTRQQLQVSTSIVALQRFIHSGA